jgi:lipid II:glycine glycyltransferase (peptidoglycan interpeptide bridge formation enzyme)
MIHFLQSEYWEKFQNHLGRKTIRRNGDNWSYLAIIEGKRQSKRLYTPYGPDFTDDNSFNAAIKSLISEANKTNVSFIRIEPRNGITKNFLYKKGFKYVSYNHLQPDKTQVIDLSRSREEIMHDMAHGTRNTINTYSKKGIEIKISHKPDDISILISLLAKVAKRNNIRVHEKEYFKKQAEALFPTGKAMLYYATIGDTPVAASLIYDDDTTRYYAHAAADDNYRKTHVGTALVGQIILDAKEKNLSFFDLYGIAPENQPYHPWAGFTSFKKGFGGYSVDYLGCWDLPIRKRNYYFYRSYQIIRSKIRLILRKLAK